MSAVRHKYLEALTVKADTTILQTRANINLPERCTGLDHNSLIKYSRWISNCPILHNLFCITTPLLSPGQLLWFPPWLQGCQQHLNRVCEMGFFTQTLWKEHTLVSSLLLHLYPILNFFSHTLSPLISIVFDSPYADMWQLSVSFRAELSIIIETISAGKNFHSPCGIIYSYSL